MRDSDREGHGTAVIHAVGGYGMKFPGRTLSEPPDKEAVVKIPPLHLDLFPEPGKPESTETVPAITGVAPFADLLPIKVTTGTNTTATNFGRMSAATSYAVRQPGICVVNLSMGGGLGSHTQKKKNESSNGQVRGREDTFFVMHGTLDHAARSGKIVTFAGGEVQPGDWNFVTDCWRSAFDCCCPTGPRQALDDKGLAAPWAAAAQAGAKGTPPAVCVSATVVVADQSEKKPSESRVNWTWTGPEVSLAAPGQAPDGGHVRPDVPRRSDPGARPG
jgi:hypothetical protein